MTSNSNLFRKTSIVLIVFALLLFASVAEASDAVVMYRSNSGSCAPKIDCPKVRFWDSTGSGSWGSEIELQDSGANVRYAVIRQAPVATKIVGVVQSSGASATLTGYVCMSHCDNVSNWKITHNVATVNGNDRAFDVMFDSHGNALLVYDDGGNTSQDLAYKILPMANTSFDNLTQNYLDDTGHGTATTYNWVRMDPSPDKCEVLLTAEDQTNHDVNAWVWNGSSWSDQTEITADFPSASGDEALAVRYALNDTIGMVVAANDSAGTVNYRYWDGATWSSVYSFYVNTSDTISWINIEPDPQTDDLQAIMIDDGAALHTAYWDGSSWYVTSNIDTDVDNGGNTRVADFDWEQTGSTGRLVWDTDQNSPGDRLSQRECNPQCTGNTTNITAYDRIGNFLTIIRNPTVTDQIKLLSVRLNSQDNIGSFSFNGTGYYNYGDSVISSDGQTGFEVETIYFQLSTTIPVVSCQVITESGHYAMFTNLVGAPNDAAPLTDTVCVKIAASDVEFDCNGYSITNNGTTGTTFGVLLNGSLTNVTVKNCPSISEYTWDAYVYNSNDSVITNTTAHSASQGGISVFGTSYNNVLSDNTVYNNTFGIFLNLVTNTNIAGNTAYNNSHGFFISFSPDTSLTDNTAFENSQNGIYARTSNNLGLTNDHLYNNTLDLQLNATSSPRIVNISGVIFDNPVGNYQYYTNLSLDDVISTDSIYTLDWSSQPAALPSPAYSSFESKYINITNVTGTVSLDSIVWHWLDSESAGYNEDYLELWKHNASGWANQTSATLNTGANTISMTSMSPGSVYAILYLTPAYPNITIESPTNTTYAVSNIDLNYTVWDNVAGVDSCWYYLNGVFNSTLGGCTNTTLNLTDGSYNLTVYVNNTIHSINSSTVYFTVDTTPPTITIQSPMNTTYNVSSIDLNYTVSDNIAVDSCWYYLNGTGPTALASCANTTLALADGYYNLTVFVNDTANNQNSSTVYFLVDTTPPSLTVLSPMNITYNTSLIPANYIASDANLDTCSVYFDGLKLPVANCANVSTLGISTDKSYNVTIIVNDTAGNVNSTTIYFTVDTTPPAITIQSPTNNTIYNTSDIDLNYTVSDNIAVDSCWYYLAGVGTLPGCGNITLTNISDGFYTLTVYVNDTAGNTNSSSIYITVDTTPPSLVIDSPTNTTYNITWIPTTYTVFDNIAVDKCWLLVDSYAPINLTNCWNVSLNAAALGDGPHNLTVYVNDTAGNINFSTVYFSVDLTPPAITIQSPTNNTIYNTSDIDLNYTVSDNIAVDSCWYYLAGVGTLPGCGNITLTNISDGFYTLTVYVNDTAGNTNSSSIYITVDTTPPSLVVSSPTNTTYNIPWVPLTYTVFDNIAVDTCWVDIDGFGPVVLPNCVNASVGVLGDGPHNVTFFVNDTANNQNSSTVYFSVDLTPPAITIQSPTNSTYNVSDIDLNYTVSDNIAVDSCWYYLNGAGPTALASCANTTLTSLADGFYNLTVFVNDTGGNQNSSTVYFTVDTTPPTVTIDSPMNITYSISTIPLNYTATDNIAVDSCWYYLDGSGPTALPGCGNITLPALSDGSHYVTVYANDTAGNEYSPVVYFSIDATPPSVTIESPTNSTYTVSGVDLNYTVSDSSGVDSCWYYLNGAGPTALPGCANSTLSSLSNGAYNVTVYANDTLGNTNSSSVFFTIAVPPSPPSGDGGGKKKKWMDVGWEQVCPGDMIWVNVTYNNEPLEGVEVELALNEPYVGLIDTQYTNESGEALVTALQNGTYRLRFTKAGYSYDNPLEIEYSMCPPGCSDDSDCASGQYCDDGECKDVECECGYVEDHQCIEYDCCEDDDCAEGYVCENNECILKPECETDEDCEDDEYCSEGECLPVECECGEVYSHACHLYECCEDEDCSDYPFERCTDHTCIPKEYRIELVNGTMTVGDESVLGLFEDGEGMPDTKMSVRSQSGEVTEGYTDYRGEFVYVPDAEGTHSIKAVGSDGRTLASTSLDATGLPIECCLFGLCGVFGFIKFLGICWYWWILLIIIAYLIYRRLRKKKKGEGEKKSFFGRRKIRMPWDKTRIWFTF